MGLGARGKRRIVEQGSHDELLRLNGHYARLWRHQSGGFLPRDIEGAETETELPDDSPPDNIHVEPVAGSSSDDAPLPARA